MVTKWYKPLSTRSFENIHNIMILLFSIIQKSILRLYNALKMFVIKRNSETKNPEKLVSIS